MNFPAMPMQVQAVFDACPVPVRQGLLQLRGLILTEAAQMPQIGPVTEALRWGQPAFLTLQTGAGCSLRIGPVKSGGFGQFVHCQSGLIPAFAAGPGAGMRFEGTRAVLFATVAEIQAAPLALLIGRALGFHLGRKLPKSPMA
jgi:hypothetical protein